MIKWILTDRTAIRWRCSSPRVCGDPGLRASDSGEPAKGGRGSPGCAHGAAAADESGAAGGVAATFVQPRSAGYRQLELLRLPPRPRRRPAPAAGRSSRSRCSRLRPGAASRPVRDPRQAGDSLLAFATVQQYLRLRPATMSPSSCARTTPNSSGARAASRWCAIAAAAGAVWALMHACLLRPFDALVVLRGFRDRVRKLGKLVPRGAGSASPASSRPVFMSWPEPFHRMDCRWWEAGYRGCRGLDGSDDARQADLPSLHPTGGTVASAFVACVRSPTSRRKDLRSRA